MSASEVERVAAVRLIEERSAVLCRTCMRPLTWETRTEPGYKPREGWYDDARSDPLICFKAIDYRHVPLTEREWAYYEAGQAATVVRDRAESWPCDDYKAPMTCWTVPSGRKALICQGCKSAFPSGADVQALYDRADQDQGLRAAVEAELADWSKQAEFWTSEAALRNDTYSLVHRDLYRYMLRERAPRLRGLLDSEPTGSAS